MPGYGRSGNIKTLSSYMMLVGILVIALSGNWIIENYDHVSIYPKTAYITFGIGWCSVICAYVMNRLSAYKEIPSKNDNRELINKWENNKTNGCEKWLIGITILTLVIVAFYSWSLAMRLLGLFLFIGIVFIGFLYVMKGDREGGAGRSRFQGEN